MESSEEQLKRVCRFESGLRFELFYALQNLFGDNSKANSDWQRQALSDLPKKLLNSGHPLTSAGDIWPVIADILTTAPVDISFGQIVTRIQNMNLNDFKFEIVNGAVHYPDIVSKAIDEKSLHAALAKVPKKKQEWLAHIGLYPYDSNSAMVGSLELLLKNPSKFRRDCIEILTEFWQCSFRQTWQNLKLSYQKSLLINENLFHSCTLDEFSKRALLKIEFDSKKGEIRALRGGSITPYKSVRSCTISPSAFNQKKFWTAFEDGDHCDIYIPIFDPSIGAAASEVGKIDDEDSDLDPALIYRALGDTTRYAMMKLISSEPKTSIELSKALSVSKPTISHHLHLLRQAHLVEEQPSGGAIYLSINKSTIESISRLSMSHFFGELKRRKKSRRKGT